MPNTVAGLEQPAAGEQVNSEAGFAKALEAKGVEPDKGDSASTDTSIAQGLETVEPGPARGPDGKFVPKSAPAPADTPPKGADTSTDGEQFTSDDPAVAEFLAKYGGNLEEAIKGAAHAQSLIGRRDEEREQLQQRLAQLEGLVEGLKAGAGNGNVQPTMTPLSDEEVEERAASRIAAMGYEGASKEAAEWASQTGDERPLRTIFDQWNIEDPWAATNFIAAYRTEQALVKVQPAPAAAPDPWVVDQKASAQMTDTFAALKAQVGDEPFAAITTIGDDGESPLTKALAELPKEVVELVVSDDAATRLAGAGIVADRALRLAGTSAAPAAPADGEGAGEMPASVARKLLGASVATAGLRPAGASEGGNEQPTREQALAAFKSAIVEAETTSVASGLTYGPQGK